MSCSILMGAHTQNLYRVVSFDPSWSVTCTYVIKTLKTVNHDMWNCAGRKQIWAHYFYPEFTFRIVSDHQQHNWSLTFYKTSHLRLEVRCVNCDRYLIIKGCARKYSFITNILTMTMSFNCSMFTRCTANVMRVNKK